MKRQRLSAVISLLAHLVTGLGPGAALGAVATWYAWGEQQRLKRMERYGGHRDTDGPGGASGRHVTLRTWLGSHDAQAAPSR